MFRFASCLAVAVAFCCAGRARADFVLIESEHLEVNSFHADGVLVDSSTANVVQGGNIVNAFVLNGGSMTVLDGSIGNWWSGGVYAYDKSSVDISDGFIRLVGASDNSGVDISGGEMIVVAARENSSVDISGGSISSVYAYDKSSVDISGGSISGASARDNGSMDISGGSIGSAAAHYDSSVDISGGSIGSVSAQSNGSVNISGGEISEVRASGTSSFTIDGYDFRAADGLLLEGGRVYGVGLLSGKWSDETPWIIDIAQNPSSATIRVVPEPSTLVLLTIGAVGLLAYARRRRR